MGDRINAHNEDWKLSQTRDEVHDETQKIAYPNSNKIKLYVTEAVQAKYLSKHSEDGNVYSKVLSNPENYAWYALATYVQGKLGEYPWRPHSPKDLPEPDDLTKVTTNDDPIDDQDLKGLSESLGFSEFKNK